MGWFRKRLNKIVRSIVSEHFPDLAGRVHVSGLGVTGKTFSEKGYDVHQYSIWVNKAVDVWSTMSEQLPFFISDEKGKEVKGGYRNLRRVLDAPSAGVTRCEFRRTLITDLGLRGEHFAEVVYSSSGKLGEIRQHEPDHITVSLSKKSRIFYEPIGYLVKAKFDEIEYDYTLHPDEMLHWKFYNPKNRARGLSPIQALKQSVLSDMYGREWNLQFFKNSARPDMIAIVPQGVTPREKDLLEDKLSEYGVNSQGAGRVLVAEEGLIDFKQWTSSQKDIQFLEMLQISREEVGAMYGLPPEFLGFGTNTYENLDRAELLVWSGKIIPLANLVDDKMTHFFRMIGELSPRHFIKTDFSGVEGLRRLYNTAFRQANLVFGMGVPFHVVNEHFGLGFPRYKGDDISHPFGTSVSFEDGEPIDKDSEFPEKGVESPVTDSSKE